MYIFEQVSGKMFDDAGELIGIGYSGFREGKNNPKYEAVHSVGPIPAGLYTIEPPRDTQTHGPFVLPLTPDPENEMFGRVAFLIHGDSVKLPGTASLGCVIMSRDVREKIWKSGDRRLKVVRDSQELKWT